MNRPHSSYVISEPQKLRLQSQTNEALAGLIDWINRNGWAGYDPYDIRGQVWFTTLFGRQTWFHRKLRGALAVAEQHLPQYALRRILRVRKEINAKGLGLLATANLILFRTGGDEKYLENAESLLSWLRTHPSEGHPGISWGYPFDWQSRIFFPRGTPSVVVTCTVGDAWFAHYELTGSSESLRILEQIAEFLLEGLNRYQKAPDEVCFSYTPLDEYKVHNANLFAAAFLARLSEITGQDDYRSLALNAVRYTLSEQNPDGSFYYWGSEPPTIIDHYHTGFILRHLDAVQMATGTEFILDPIERGYRFYVERLFTREGIPKFTPDSLYPIDIHACAEAILCLLQLGPALGELDRAERVLQFTIDNMRAEEGYYIAAIHKRWWGQQRLRVPYMRWGQAWMLLALARLHENLASADIEPGRQGSNHQANA